MASYEKDDNGTWSVRFRATESGALKNKRLRGFERKKDAEEAYRAFMKEYEITPDTAPQAMPFQQLFFQYQSHIANRLKTSTQIDIASIVKIHIMPFFENQSIVKINKVHILNWQNSLNEKNYSYEYKSKMRSYLYAIFKFAVRYFDLPANPLDGVEPFRNTEIKKEMLFWSKDEFNQFIEAVKEPLYHAFFNLLYYSGLRKGEAIALTWADVEGNIVNVNKNFTRKVSKENTKGYDISTPKNNSSYRKVTLPKLVISELMDLKGNSPNHFFIFGGEHPISDRILDTPLKKGCEKSGVKKIRMHDFRHSHVSFLIDKGINIVAIAKRLGHSDVEQTLNTYAHLLPQSESAIIEALNS